MHTSDGVDEVQAGLEHALIQPAEATDINQSAVPEAAAAHPQQGSEVDLVAKIVKQVNFYFSDTNLPTDNFLLKEVRKTPEGWVPIRLIASFKRMKSLSKDIKVIAAALETSTELVVSGHRVRRKEPLPQVDETEVLYRTAIVDNLPDQATIDSLTGMFSAAGKVKMQVAAAVKQLTDSNNWRSGLRVRPLLRHAFQPQQPHGKAHSRQQQAQQQQQQQQGNAARLSQDQASDQSSQTKDQPVDSITQSEQGASQTTDSQKPDQAAIEASGESQRPDADLQTDQTETPVSERQGKASGRSQKSKRTKKDYAAWAGATAETRAIASAQLQSNADGAEASEPTQTGQPNTPGQPAAPGSTQPKMPDGSRLAETRSWLQACILPRSAYNTKACTFFRQPTALLLWKMLAALA
ncbi:hypothetical protein WJX79_009222 [Trebouxia sp. C0005]